MTVYNDCRCMRCGAKFTSTQEYAHLGDGRCPICEKEAKRTALKIDRELTPVLKSRKPPPPNPLDKHFFVREGKIGGNADNPFNRRTFI